MSRAFTKEPDGEPERAIVVERPAPIDVTLEGVERLRTLARDAADPQRRAELEARAAAAVVPAPPADRDVVAFGATVTVRARGSGELRRFVLVGDDEIDVARGRVGVPSPLGVALAGRRVGDAVVWERPAGDEPLTIESIDYARSGASPGGTPPRPPNKSPMQQRRTTFSKFIIENERRHEDPHPDLTALLNDVQTACKFIASAVSRGALDADAPSPREIMLRECEWGGMLCGIASPDGETPYAIPATYPRGRYLLAFDALDGSPNLDIDVAVGTIFSILRAPEGVTEPVVADFLQAGTRQIAAGFALYGPSSTIVITLGSGVHGFTLDREIGAYTLTHPNMQIPHATREFAIDASNERAWETPVRHYIGECVAGEDGPRGAEFTMRWVDSLAAEVYRVLVRGGLFIDPRDAEGAAATGRLHLLFEAAPMAMIVEQAGGAASTGRGRVLDIVPTQLLERVPLILGSREEVERLERYHETFDNGEELAFETPLFKTRSLFRAG